MFATLMDSARRLLSRLLEGETTMQFLCQQHNQPMAHIGKDDVGGCLIFRCPQCYPHLGDTRFYAATVVRTGAQDFCFLEVDRYPEWGQLRFWLRDVRPSGHRVFRGDHVLTRLGRPAGSRQMEVRAVYYPNGGVADGRGTRTPNVSPPDVSLRQGQVWERGTVDRLTSPTTCFVRPDNGGRDVFVHKDDCLDPVLRPGTRVEYQKVIQQDGRLRGKNVRRAQPDMPQDRLHGPITTR